MICEGIYYGNDPIESFWGKLKMEWLNDYIRLLILKNQHDRYLKESENWGVLSVYGCGVRTGRCKPLLFIENNNLILVMPPLTISENIGIIG
jgi:hypothetical protein